MNTVLEEHDGKRQEEQGGWGGHSFQPPPPPGPLLRYLSSEMGGPGPGGVGLGLGAVSLFLRYIAWWPVRSGNPYYVFACDLTKRGPRCAFVREGVRVSSAGSRHLTVVSCVRPCSITTRLPCVAEGGSFFAAADPAGERGPFKTIGRYAFLPVRRACAPVVESRKSLIFH